MLRHIGLVAAGAFVPVARLVILPVGAVAVSVTKHRNFKRFLESADGAAARLAAGFCRACFFSHRPLAEAVLRHIGLVAAGAFVPVARRVILPVGAVAVSVNKHRNFKRFLESAEGAAARLTAGFCRACFLGHRPLAEGMRRDLCLSAAGALPPVFGITSIRTGIGVLVYCF